MSDSMCAPEVGRAGDNPWEASGRAEGGPWRGEESGRCPGMLPGSGGRTKSVRKGSVRGDWAGIQEWIHSFVHSFVHSLILSFLGPALTRHTPSQSFCAGFFLCLECYPPHFPRLAALYLEGVSSPLH